MLLFSLIPVLNFFLLYVLSLNILPSGPGIRRQSFLCAAAFWATEVVGASEILNLFDALHYGPVLIFWILSSLILAAILFRHPPSVRPVPIPDWKIFTAPEKVMLAIISMIILLVAIVAFMSAPNGWDALTYHMSRVYFWHQNHSIDHYPTVDWRQLFYQPFSSFVHLHFQILTGTDRFAALTSWFSFLGLILGISLIGVMLGLSRRGQILAGFCAVTIPTAIVEASGVRGDPVAAFWLVCFVSFLLLFRKNPAFIYVFIMGLILGVGALTKGTFTISCAPFVVWFLGMAYRPYRWRRWLGALLVMGSLALVLNAGFFSRNMLLAGDIVDTEHVGQNAPVCLNSDPRLWISNILRTTAAQLATPVKPLNRLVLNFVEQTHSWMGISMIDPRNTYTKIMFAMNVSTYEDNVTNFLQMILLIAGLVIVFFHAPRFRNTPLILYLGIVIFSYDVTVSVMKWSHHFTRYVLPLGVLGMIVVPVAVDKILQKGKNFVLFALILTLTCTATPYVFKNNLRRLVSGHKQTVFTASRRELYFLNDLSVLEAYTQAIQQLPPGCLQIGLYMGLFDWDYPLAVMLREELGRDVRIEHVNPAAFSPAQYPLGDFKPCAVITRAYQEDRLYVAGYEFEKIQEISKGAVYRQKIKEPIQEKK